MGFAGNRKIPESQVSESSDLFTIPFSPALKATIGTQSHHKPDVNLLSDLYLRQIQARIFSVEQIIYEPFYKAAQATFEKLRQANA